MIVRHMIVEAEVVEQLRCRDLPAHHRLSLPQRNNRITPPLSSQARVYQHNRRKADARFWLKPARLLPGAPPAKADAPLGPPAHGQPPSVKRTEAAVALTRHHDAAGLIWFQQPKLNGSVRLDVLFG
jgi:hypothetical protein